MTTAVINQDLYLIVINAAKVQNESCIDIWKYNRNEANKNGVFVLHDVIYVVGPRSVSTVNYKGNSYLAIASSYVRDAVYKGMVDVRR